MNLYDGVATGTSPLSPAIQAAIILAAVSAVLYYTTRNLAASIIANATFTFAGGALTLYHALLHR
jgi:hypothetical protein